MRKIFRFLLWSVLTSCVTFSYLVNVASLWQIDLMRHIFVTECHRIEDIWIVKFGFPVIGEMLIQSAFDFMVLTSFLSLIFLSLVYISLIAFYLRRKKEE